MKLGRSWLWVVLAALAPLWVVGILDRQLWTPDEPREADIVWHMASQTDRTIPQFAGEPFVEKPPLSYWISATSISLFGDSAAAARAPNLLYAWMTALAIGALAFAMRGRVAAIVASLVVASSVLTWHVTAWLAPDACLLAGCAISLLGAYLGYQARPGARKLLGYTVMHLGAALGFMAKSAPGWLVPGIALLTLIVWERRWSELKRWELYAGLIVQALIIGPWILAVKQLPNGVQTLREFFWNNLVGRFTKIPAPEALDYTRAHKNWPGRYFVELPFSFLPWTLLMIAAMRRAWHRVRADDAASTAWRFAVAACLPFLLLLSVAATARDIYAAPIAPGLSLLVALWAVERRPESRLDRIAVRVTSRIVAVVALAFTAALLLLAAVAAPGSPVLAYLVAGLLTSTVAILTWRSSIARRKSIPRSIIQAYAGYAAALTLTALAVFPVFDRWQNLGALAQEIHSDTASKPLALLEPDETTVAMLDYRLKTPFTPLNPAPDQAQRTATDWLRSHGPNARILVKMPGLAAGELTPLFDRWHKPKPLQEGLVSALKAAGISRIVAQYQLPHGRAYVLLGPALTRQSARPSGNFASQYPASGQSIDIERGK